MLCIDKQQLWLLPPRFGEQTPPPTTATSGHVKYLYTLTDPHGIYAEHTWAPHKSHQMFLLNRLTRKFFVQVETVLRVKQQGHYK